eukprot:scaffold187667_cov23-Tisochrysis_lutea.AAC.1
MYCPVLVCACASVQLEEMQAQMQQLQAEMRMGAQNLEAARSVPVTLNLQDFTGGGSVPQGLTLKRGLYFVSGLHGGADGDAGCEVILNISSVVQGSWHTSFPGRA